MNQEHYPHRIRLRGPWHCEPLARSNSTDPLPAPCRMNLPCRWGDGNLGNFAGRIRFRRHFGLPTRLEPQEHVWLTFAGMEGEAEIWLNSQPLVSKSKTGEPFEFEVTGLLQIRNELRMEVTAPDGEGGPWGDVALEIRR